jgi:Flp pilus assembly protein TadG
MQGHGRMGVARGNDIVVLTRGRRQRRPGDQPKRGRGQALVEFALVVPIMILIFGALVQFAFIFERQIGIENAVRDGARRAATYETVDATDAAVNGPFTWNLVFGSGGLMLTNVQGYDGLSTHAAKVCYTNQTAANGVSSVLVSVSVGYSHPLFLPLISQLLDPLDGVIDGALRVDTRSEFVVQNDPTIPTSVVGSPLCYP